MPHPRKRHLESLITTYIKTAPSISLEGQRQTGKTTLLKKLAKKEYLLDQEAVRADLERNLLSRLETGPYPILLDEAQKLPILFDELKGLIDARKTPGRFLLTGSVRLNTKKVIRESLTGRTLIFELLPLGLAESHHKGLSPVWDWLFDPKQALNERLLERIKARSWSTPIQIAHFLDVGGLPGICFQRNERLRNELMQSHIDTLLGRDLASVYQGKLSSAKVRLFLSLLSGRQGEPLNLSELARKVGTTSPTLKNYLQAFESLFLVRELGSCYYFEDQGMASFLNSFTETLPEMNLRRFLFAELQQQIHYRQRAQAHLESYQPRRGVPIPFIFTPKKPGRKLAIITEADEVASNTSLKALTWFLKRYPAGLGLVLHSGKNFTIHSDRIASLPLHWVP